MDIQNEYTEARKSGNATEIKIKPKSLFYSFPDVYDSTPENIDRYIVMTSGDIIVSARNLIKMGWKKWDVIKSYAF